MAVKEIVGLASAVLILAGLSMVVTRGTDVANILSATGNSFARVINAATLRG